ncbi:MULTISPECIES: hypothetical protein [unclassified Nocardia]|uniref:hypothetical protein n=1 Tax=unclassified Nocardia TaxID=2637762 RepID=UPI001CE45EC5|nr:MULTISPECIES: hypothetical protein [unclassified Nocardia]
MGEILQVDAAALRDLGGTLTGHASDIADIKVDATVTMPNSPIGDATAAVGPAALAAFGALGNNIQQMAGVATSGATSYQDVEHAFADEFQRLAAQRPVGRRAE